MRGRRISILLAAIVACGCATVETEQPLSWFKTKNVRYPNIGGFSGSSSGRTPYVKRYGLFWKELEGCLGGEVLDRKTVAVFCSEPFNSGVALIRKGEATPVPACGAYSSYSQIVADRSAVDCTTKLAGRAPVVPTKLRYWRVGLTRETVFDTTLAIVEPGRAFVGPLPRFYDERNRGYFVTALDDDDPAADCALLTVDDGALTVVATAPDLRRSDCYEPAAWSQRTGRSLRTP